MLHHAAMDAGERRVVADLLALPARSPGARLATMRELALAGAAA